MTALTNKYFNIIEYVQKLKQVNFTQDQAEVIMKIFTQQNQSIDEQ